MFPEYKAWRKNCCSAYLAEYNETEEGVGITRMSELVFPEEGSHVVTVHSLRITHPVRFGCERSGDVHTYDLNAHPDIAEAAEFLRNLKPDSRKNPPPFPEELSDTLLGIMCVKHVVT